MGTHSIVLATGGGIAGFPAVPSQSTPFFQPIVAPDEAYERAVRNLSTFTAELRAWIGAAEDTILRIDELFG